MNSSDLWQLGFMVLNHLPDIIAFCGVAWVWITNKNKSESDKARDVVFQMAVSAAKLAAEQAIENKERRQWAISAILESMGPDLKKHVDSEMVGMLLEKAYLQVIKPNL